MTPVEKELTRARLSEIKRAIQSLTNNDWLLEQAFQERLCSCHPLRAKEQALEVQIAEARRHHIAPLEEQLCKMRTERYRIDGKEHPAIGKVVEEARPWLRLWLLEHLLDGETDAIEGGLQQVSARYVDAWVSGWRPSLNTRDGTLVVSMSVRGPRRNSS